MANQTGILTGTLNCIPKTPLLNTQTLSFSPFLNPLFVSLPQPKTQLRYSILCNHSNDHYSQAVSYPRPSEVPWKKELCNSVSLIGIVGAPVEMKHLSSGKVLAWTRLAVKKSASDSTWINLTFWDELAHVASQHVEKGQQIHVSGRLVSDTVENDEGKQQTYYKVVVQQLNFVERGVSSVEDSNPSAAGRKLGSPAFNSTGSTEELWQAFFANPIDWWDNRKSKKNPKYPDFKHKDTGEALWVEGRYNPSWVKSQLEILDSKMESLREQHVNFMSGDNFMPF